VCRISLVHCGQQLSVLDTALAAATGFYSLHMKRHVEPTVVASSAQCDTAHLGYWSVLLYFLVTLTA